MLDTFHNPEERFGDDCVIDISATYFFGRIIFNTTEKTIDKNNRENNFDLSSMIF